MLKARSNLKLGSCTGGSVSSLQARATSTGVVQIAKVPQLKKKISCLGLIKLASPLSIVGAGPSMSPSHKAQKFPRLLLGPRRLMAMPSLTSLETASTISCMSTTVWK